MIEKHIVNIGHPRTGTSWLWHHAGFEPRGDKENNILTTDLNFDQYLKYYCKFKISANFQPALWCVDREIVNFVQQYATHISMIVRNPFDFVERYVDWIYQSQDTSELIDYIVFSGFIKYHDITTRWSTNATKFQMFFFEDLERNPAEFFEDYMSFCEIPVAKNNYTSYNNKINANTKLVKTKINFTQYQINFINQEIDKFQLLISKDLTHWKR